MGCHFLLQGIFPTQGSNSHLWPWQADSFSSEPPGKPVYGVVGSLTDAAEFPWILARPPAPLPLKLPPALYPEQQKGRRGEETTGHHGEPVQHKASRLGAVTESARSWKDLLVSTHRCLPSVLPYPRLCSARKLALSIRVLG